MEKVKEEDEEDNDVNCSECINFISGKNWWIKSRERADKIIKSIHSLNLSA